jgi:transcriptional regulator with XRE-family HTH domain
MALANRARISRPTLDKWLNAEPRLNPKTSDPERPALRTLRGLAEALDVPLDYLVQLEEGGYKVAGTYPKNPEDFRSFLGDFIIRSPLAQEKGNLCDYIGVMVRELYAIL